MSQLALISLIAITVRVIVSKCGRALWLLPDWGKKLVELAYDIRRFRRTGGTTPP
jgi:hypothetical protein